MNKRKVEILQKSVAYKGYLGIEKYRVKHSRFHGGSTQELEREILERGKVVGVLPYDPVSDQIILIEQFRIGAHCAKVNAWQVEIVAGVIEEGESPEQVARRETHEETGKEVSRIHHIGDFLVSPGCTSEEMHLYCGEVSTDSFEGIFGLPHEGEDIRAFTLTFDEAYLLLRDRKLTNFPVMAAIQWFVLNHDFIRGAWMKS